MTLELTTAQAAALTDLLHDTLGSMSVEIRHTDSPGFRTGLRERRDALRAIHDQLSRTAVA
jgi:hypothetical protein